MTTKWSLLFIIFALQQLRIIHGHGMMMEPVNRSSAWRKGFETPINYDDNELNCGGGTDHDSVHNGTCGVCGDPYSNDRPRPNENGGKYGTGIIVKTYTVGEEIEVAFVLNTNHKGYCEFSLCVLDDEPEAIETEECFKKYPLQLKNGKFRYYVKPGTHFNTTVVLPEGVTCEHCVLRWHYRAGNNWGWCSSRRGRLGCGPQEVFRTCSDIAIKNPEEDFTLQPDDVETTMDPDDLDSLETTMKPDNETFIPVIENLK